MTHHCRLIGPLVVASLFLLGHSVTEHRPNVKHLGLLSAFALPVYFSNLPFRR